MLVLSRKVGQRLIIADSVVVTVTEIDRGRVRLGIEAPQNIRVLREELRSHAPPLPAAAATAGAGNWGKAEG